MFDRTCKYIDRKSAHLRFVGLLVAALTSACDRLPVEGTAGAAVRSLPTLPGDTPSTPSGPDLLELESPDAAKLLTSLRDLFGTASKKAEAIDPSPTTRRAALPPSSAAAFRRVGDALLPIMISEPGGTLPHLATSSFPVTANGAFAMADRTTKHVLQIKLAGTVAAPVESSGGYAIYRDSLGHGVHLLVRPTSFGIEDSLVLDGPIDSSPVSSVVYDVRLDDRTVSLRVVDNAVEFLDAEHHARFHMSPPYLIAADGAQRMAAVHVSGCAVNTDLNGFVPTGARDCQLRVSWPTADVTYPALLDPTWATTGAMTYARENHIASRLGSGSVLVAGGHPGNLVSTSTAEFYSVKSGGWTVVSSMGSPRRSFAACTLVGGKVLVAGGHDAYVTTLSSAELFDPVAETWSPTGSLKTAREDYVMTCLSDGRALASGGTNPGGILNNSEVYDPTSGTWSSAGTMPFAVHTHQAALLADGRVLVAGGNNALGPTNSAAVWNPSTKSWKATGAMSTGRAWFSLSILNDGRVLAAGGLPAPWAIGTAEIYSPSSATWSRAANLNVGRYSVAGALVGAAPMVTAGVDAYANWLASSEVYDMARNSWTLLTMPSACSDHTATAIDESTVLVAGGSNGSTAISTSELFFGPKFRIR